MSMPKNISNISEDKMVLPSVLVRTSLFVAGLFLIIWGLYSSAFHNLEKNFSGLLLIAISLGISLIIIGYFIFSSSGLYPLHHTNGN